MTTTLSRENGRENAGRRSHSFSGAFSQKQANSQASHFSHTFILTGLSLRDRESEKRRGANVAPDPESETDGDERA